VKDAYIHDGSGWQSLKGPPGPSAASADSGNRVTVGSDSLLYCPAVVHTTGSYVVAQAGDDLRAKYTQAASLLPRSSPLSATNRGCLLIMPGTYQMAGQLVVNTEFVDVVGLGGSLYNPGVLLQGGTINVTANDVRVSGIDVGAQRFTVAADRNLARFFNCRGTGTGSFGLSVKTSSTFDFCIAGSSAFGFNAETNGIFRDCIGGDNCFGSFVSSGEAAGTFLRCRAGGSSFGSSNGATGRFEDCVALQGSFGSPITGAPTVIRCLSSFTGGGIEPFLSGSKAARYLYCGFIGSGSFSVTGSSVSHDKAAYRYCFNSDGTAYDRDAEP